LSELVDGGINGAGRIAVKASVLYPAYATMRAATRMAAWQAMTDEMAGNVDEGNEIRQSVVHVGALMRSNGSNLICNLVGIAITRIAMRRPGGAPAIEDNTTLPQAQRSADVQRRMLRSYEDYLTDHHYSAEAAWLGQEAAAGQAVRTGMMPNKFANGLLDACIDDVVLLIGSWMALGAVLFAALLWIGSTIIAKAARLRDTGKGGKQAFMLIAVGSLATIVLIAGLIRVVMQAGRSYAASQRFMNDTQSFVLSEATVGAIIVAALLAYVLLMTGTAWLRRKPALQFVLDSTIRGALPAVCILLLAYCGTLVFLARQDQIIKQELVAEQQIGEGPYVAQLSGKPWPGVIPWPSTR
jgi:hypothetical protein